VVSKSLAFSILVISETRKLLCDWDEGDMDCVECFGGETFWKNKNEMEG
jgi:hypothetical protein